jgi:hypothetical protein
MSNAECTKKHAPEMRVFCLSMIRSPSIRNCSIHRPWAAFVAAGALLGSIPCMTGCGTTLPPTERLVSTEARVAGAEKDGADQVPAAKEVLNRARTAVARAKTELAQGKRVVAEELLLRAGADAELADALAHEGQVAAEVAKAKAALASEEASK